MDLNAERRALRDVIEQIYTERQYVIPPAAEMALWKDVCALHEMGVTPECLLTYLQERRKLSSLGWIAVDYHKATLNGGRATAGLSRQAANNQTARQRFQAQEAQRANDRH